MSNTDGKKLTQLPNSIAADFAGKQVLITGGAGFIGSALARALVSLGANVTLLDAQMPLYGANRFNIEAILDKVEFIEGDIRDLAAMKKAAAGKDIIYNLAAQVSYLDAQAKPFEDLDINGRGHLTVLEAVREEAPKATILFASSRMVYGKIRQLPVSEAYPTDPLSLYGIHKLLGEKYYTYYARTWGLRTMSVRIPNPYGPRQQMKHSKYSIVGWFVRLAMEGQTLTIYGDGKQQRDYVYIDDIVDAFLHLTLKGEAGEVYNIGSHERITFEEMVDTVLRIVGSGGKQFMDWPEDYERNETGDYVADTAKIEAATDWRPQVGLEQGLAAMVSYYRTNKEHYW